MSAIGVCSSIILAAYAFFGFFIHGLVNEKRKCLAF
jgi:hypothetical protein